MHDQTSLGRDKGARIMWLQSGPYHLGGLAWLIAAIVIFIIAIIALILAGSALTRAGAARRAGIAYTRGAPRGPGAPGTGPEDRKLPESHRMLDERYARGEISREEYMQRQADLQSKV
jgi:uncharacterized membrane protein